MAGTDPGPPCATPHAPTTSPATAGTARCRRRATGRQAAEEEEQDHQGAIGANALAVLVVAQGETGGFGTAQQSAAGGTAGRLQQEEEAAGQAGESRGMTWIDMAAAVGAVVAGAAAGVVAGLEAEAGAVAAGTAAPQESGRGDLWRCVGYCVVVRHFV